MYAGLAVLSHNILDISDKESNCSTPTDQRLRLFTFRASFRVHIICAMTSLTTELRLVSQENNASIAKRDCVMQPEEVAELIAQGQTIVIYQDYVLRLDSWLDRHPGGRLAILHMVGKDATDEMEV